MFETRKAERERQAAVELDKSESERRERGLRLKWSRRVRAEEKKRRLAEEEVRMRRTVELKRRDKEINTEERRKKKEDYQGSRRKRLDPQSFSLENEKEKEDMLVAIATAQQAASNLLNACRVSQPMIFVFVSLSLPSFRCTRFS